MARRPPSRPGARLGLVAVILIAAYSTMLGIGHATPRLGLDLQGGTTVTLTPKGKVNAGALNQAVDIIRQRVNGLGVSEAEVVKQGGTVVISVPGKGRDTVLKEVAQTAQLTFREIYTEGSGLPTTPSATPGGTARTPTTRTTTRTGAPSTGTSTGTRSLSPTATASAAPTPASSGTAHPALLPGALAPAVGAAPAASPSAPPRTAVSPTPSSGAVSTTAPQTTTLGSTATSAGGAAPPVSVLAEYAKTVCVPGTRPPSADTAQPTDYVVACDRTSALKYLLKPADIVGTDVSSVVATPQQTASGTATVFTGAWVVDLTFKGRAQGKVQRITGRLFAAGRQPLAIDLDGVVESAPAIDAALSTNAEISGGGSNGFTQGEATALANVLKYGALPVAFDKSSVQSISASLGRDSLRAGLLAGALGLLLVLVYCFVYYRALGIVTVVSLSVSGLCVYAAVVLLGRGIGFTLSLAGIAGLIVSVGITADSFVVFYERLKDEVREGRTVRTSVERGWVRARRTIVSADVVSILAAGLLYVVSIGSVRGFAFTLGVSTLLDLFVVFLFTKPLVTLLIRRSLFSTSALSGLAPGQAGIPRLARPGSAARGGAPASPTVTEA